MAFGLFLTYFILLSADKTRKRTEISVLLRVLVVKCAEEREGKSASLMGRIENLEDYDVPPLGIVCPDLVRTDIYRKKFGRYKEYYDGCKAGGNKQ